MEMIRQQQKYDTEANWIANDPIILPGEIAITIDLVPMKYKVGTEVIAGDSSIGTNWSNLQYLELSGAGIKYSNPNPTPETVHGIPGGSTFDEQTMTEMWNALLYPYQTPAFSLFNIDGLGTLKEVGYEFSAATRNFSWNTTNQTNIIDFSIEISGPGITTEQNLGNSGDLGIAMSAISRNTEGSEIWTIQGTDTHSHTFSRTFTTRWSYRMHFGNFAGDILNEDDIEGLSDNAFATSFNGIKHFIAESQKYKVITYPSVWGTATIFKDQSTNLDIPMEPFYIVTLTNFYGVSYDVKVHRSTNKLGGEINMIVG